MSGNFDGAQERPFDRLRVSGYFDGAQERPFDRLRVSGNFGGARERPFDRLRVSGAFGGARERPFDRLRVSGAFGGARERPFDRLRVSGAFGGARERPFDRLRVSGNFDGAQDRPFDRLRVSGNFGGARDRPFDRLRVSGNFGGARERPFDGLRVSGYFDGAQDRPLDRLRVSGSGRLGCGVLGFGGLVADYVYDELLGGGDPVVGLEAVDPVLHDVVQEVDDGAAVDRLGADEHGHEVLIHRREHSEEVLREGGRGVHPARRIRVGAGVGLAGASTQRVAAGDAAVLLKELGGGPGPVLFELLGGVDPVAEFSAIDPVDHDVDEEVDDEAAVVGLLADDVCECGRLPLRGCFYGLHGIGHGFYYTGELGRVKRGIFTTEDTESTEGRSCGGRIV